MDPASAATNRTAAAALVAALVLVLAFAASYVGAFHKPTPHAVPIALVVPPAQAPALARQLGTLPGDPLDPRVAASRQEALRLVEDREVYGVYEPAANRLDVVSVANRATALALELTLDRVAAQQGRPAVAVTDLRPLPAEDPNGTSPFYAVVAWVFGGYLAATLLGTIGANRSRSRRRAVARVGALGLYAVIAAGLSSLLLQGAYGVFDGHTLAMWGVGTLTIFASGAATAGIQASAGIAGTGLVILLFVILGNAASGGPYARPLLPGFWRTVGGLLPPGAGVDLARSALYFDGARSAGPIAVLLVWALAGGAVAIGLGGRVVDRSRGEAEAAAGAAL